MAGISDLTWGSPVRPLVGSYPDAFAAKLNGAGGLQWNTFLGSSDWEEAYGIALDAAANVYVAGWSNGTWGSPVRAFDTAPDAFAAKLNDAGALVWNTFLGGSGDDYGYAITAAAGGDLYLTGGSLATWGSPVLPYSGDGDAFAAGLDPGGVLQWHAFLGSGSWDEGRAVAADSARNIYCLGKSEAGWGSPVRPYSSNLDTFVARFSLDTLWRPRHAAGDFDGDGADELVADFGASGIWRWDAGDWTQISTSNPESMILAEYDGNDDDEIFLDLGSAGLWLLNGPVWMQWSAANVETMAAGDVDNDGNDEIACDFGAVGLWLWNAGSWDILSGVNADFLIRADLDDNGSDEVPADFGTIGFWVWNSGSWTQQSGVNPEYLLAADFDGDGRDEIAGDFGAAGLWLWNDGAWSQISPSNPE